MEIKVFTFDQPVKVTWRHEIDGEPVSRVIFLLGWSYVYGEYTEPEYLSQYGDWIDACEVDFG